MCSSDLINTPQTIQVKLYITGPVIYVDQDALTGANNGSCWNDAFRNLSDALNFARTGDDIWAAEGSYVTTSTYQMKEGVDLYGGFDGTETQLNQRNWTTHITILDGNNIVRVINGANNARLDGFKIQRGSAEGGGGMRNNSCSPTIENCTFSSNRDNAGLNHYGGGMYNSSASPTIINCVFASNLSSDYGGGLGIQGGSPLVKGCTFTGNNATGNGGAAMYVNGPATITECIFTSNQSDYRAGAIYIAGGTPTISNCIFRGNWTPHSLWCQGGAIFTFGSPIVTNCTFYGNSAQEGGSIYSYGAASPKITNCISWGNSAKIGRASCRERV